jgi:hypothetical protein
MMAAESARMMWASLEACTSISFVTQSLLTVFAVTFRVYPNGTDGAVKVFQAGS